MDHHWTRALVREAEASEPSSKMRLSTPNALDVQYM